MKGVASAGASAAILSVPSSVLAAPPDGVGVCKAKANNCQMGKFIPPNPMKKSDMAAAVEKVLSSYPQGGIEKVDLGGNKFVTNDLASSGYAKMEFTSGIGNFAKYLNGGKPFVDDFEVLVRDDGVEYFSSSRVGDSDLGVNAKRVAYIKKELATATWV
eukprot:CAMPEP_0118655444 /NCGR_PEP_ID=MMETSP0785-20121206/12928_1 /TAXON_ID=91992 /ORGANISM="Bolidomonas pacifica, Strain CCMP 1866" /LENGTH=158 /DNA_ID=CAMNT_0006548175 /DNA_START=76 /DNA_END=552 /DNA_ORIENTATION=-